MTSRFAQRLLGAIAIAAIGAMAAGVVANADAAAITLVVGIAGALAAIGTRDDENVAKGDAEGNADQLLGEVLDTIVEPVLLIRGGVVSFANAAATKLLGDHIVGEDARVAIRHPAAAGRLASRGGDDRPVELHGLGSPDQRWEMRVGEAGDGARIVQLIDRTGNYAAERMRVDFVANASHELRTPLASILGYVETLSEEAGEDPGIRARFLKVMFDEARRMQRLVEDLISLSRIEAEKYRTPAETIDLAMLAEDIRDELARGGSERARDVSLTIQTEGALVAGDRAQLSQLLHNLIGNAMKYGRPGTPVRVTLGRDGERMLRLAIEDQGDGIAPEHIPRLTERFYRVDAGRSRSLGGTGLGLAIVKHIVERHRGRLDIQSRVGVGTTVAVVMPRAQTAVIKG
ncbi:two-component system phosphate regulon sensor histidine kinase PhoR [Sphingomonas jinjuensis]|uniref:histidine kinase n=1 Tax=Sphingomonas jinjuensis TaxID=535907 RepID=A0A840FB95_9SPHN|nr:ATP-binding protein [Sphingomonas jinjuensis]MBB4152797.1 two-component system phosphate regulon sensor histidine kinase PhoR [Sphingomonas jinjuensis]